MLDSVSGCNPDSHQVRAVGSNPTTPTTLECANVGELGQSVKLLINF